MGSSTNINSILKDLADAANETDMVKCDHFSIRGFVAERREREHRKCWPFSEESDRLMGQQNYSLPPLSVQNFRWWRCPSCIKGIHVDGTKDCGLHSNSTTITNQKNLDENSSVIKDIDVDGSKGTAVEEIENVNGERSQENDQTATTFLKKVHHPQSIDASTVRSKIRKLASPEQVDPKKK